MTGFGKDKVTENGKNIAIEVRSLNSKQLDIATRIHPFLRELDSPIRTIIANELLRGKIDIIMTIEQDENPVVSINKPLATTYFNAFSGLAKDLNCTVNQEVFLQVIKMPDVLSEAKENLLPSFVDKILETVVSTCKQVSSFRTEEGQHLSEDLRNRVSLILHQLDEIKQFEEQRVKEIRDKLIHNLQQLYQNVDYDKNRFEAEMIYYLEKMDITEEKVRLGKHCNYFFDIMNEEESVGKKLSFIAQEMGREINTIGSKASNFDIQKIVVRMKDELEKIKEQLANIL
jgi:uncharacterized protein (TIGR00255 family)